MWAGSDLRWLEQLAINVPATDDWLSPDEIARLSALRFPKRRSDWRLGRWTAKRALCSFFQLPAGPAALAGLAIASTPGGAPVVHCRLLPACQLSLSHSAGHALCVVSVSSQALGCDLETDAPRSESFVGTYCTPAEQALVRRYASLPWLPSLLWSAKESVLKAVAEGLREDTRNVSVNPVLDGDTSAGWLALTAIFRDGRPFSGWWRRSGGFVRTVVASPPPAPPQPLPPL